MKAWAVVDRACGVSAGLMQSLSWLDRFDVLRRSIVLRSRQGWSRLRTAAEVGWYRQVLRGRVDGLPVQVVAGETWHRIDGMAAARRVAAAQSHVSAARCLSDIYTRTEHTDPCLCQLDDRGRLLVLMFYLGSGRPPFVLRYPAEA
jgi:hypothetical protein